MELLPGFPLDSLGIGLELVDLPGVVLVFLLQLVDFFLEPLVLGALRAVNDHPVIPEHDMHKQPDGHKRHPDRGQASTLLKQLSKKWLEASANSICMSLSELSWPGEKLQPFSGWGANADFGEYYSKIHCLASALSASSSAWLGASEYTLTTGSVPESR
jgi:hypothetical protein